MLRFFYFVDYSSRARVCLGARTWACVCAYVCACMRVRVRVGVTFVQHHRGVVFMHTCCKKDTLWRLLHNYNTFLQSIEDISVSLCSKNSDLVSKAVQIRQDS